MKDYYPNHPSENRRLPDGLYDAEVRQVSTGEYRSDQLYVRIILWLPAAECCIASNIYCPQDRPTRSHQRLWFFSQCVGVDANEALDAPHLFEGRTLRLQLKQNDAKISGVRRVYSDVALFLPSLQDAVAAQPVHS